jgi:hypothetical protein
MPAAPLSDDTLQRLRIALETALGGGRTHFWGNAHMRTPPTVVTIIEG